MAAKGPLARGCAPETGGGSVAARATAGSCVETMPDGRRVETMPGEDSERGARDDGGADERLEKGASSSTPSVIE